MGFVPLKHRDRLAGHDTARLVEKPGLQPRAVPRQGGLGLRGHDKRRGRLGGALSCRNHSSGSKTLPASKQVCLLAVIHNRRRLQRARW